MFPTDKNRGGRPRKSPDERRSIRITLCLRRDEYLRITRSGMSPTEYLRAACDGVTIRSSAGPTPLQITQISRAILALRSGDLATTDILLSELLAAL